MYLTSRGKILFTPNQEPKMKTKENINPNRKRNIIVGVGFGLLAITGFGYWYFAARKKNTEISQDDFLKEISQEQNSTPKTKPKSNTTKPPAPQTKPGPPTSSIGNKNFPIKFRSKGPLVKQIQEALIKTYGKSILPAHGADGDYGSELKAALTSKGFPAVIDEITFKKIVGTPIPPTQNIPNDGLSPAVKENIDIAKNIWLNATIKKFDALLEQLKRIKSVDQYSKINAIFKTIRLRGVRQTIVNAALSTFSDVTSTQLITSALQAIGLKYYDEQWHLSGLFNRQFNSHQKTFRYV